MTIYLTHCCFCFRAVVVVLVLTVVSRFIREVERGDVGYVVGCVFSLETIGLRSVVALVGDVASVFFMKYERVVL